MRCHSNSSGTQSYADGRHFFHKCVESLGVTWALSFIFRQGECLLLIYGHPLWWLPLMVKGKHLADVEREVYGYGTENRKIKFYEKTEVVLCVLDS